MNERDEAAVRAIKGRQIVAVEIENGQVSLVLANDVVLIVSRDPEQNGPGSLLVYAAPQDEADVDGPLISILGGGR